jgi:hypothetical protein
VSTYTIRRLCPSDAAGVARLIESVYGDTYFPRDLYNPEQILRLNDAGQLISVVAVDSTAQVVGHYALERPNLEAIAESSDAVVLPEHRHHHLLEEMRVLLREEALRLGLTGIVAYTVTNHVFAQQAEEHFGAHPCGVALGLWPRSFHNLPEPLPQRMSFVIYFKYLRLSRHTCYVTTHHREMLSRIARQYDLPIEQKADTSAEGVGEIAVEYTAAVQAGDIWVRRVGADTVAAVRQVRQELCEGSGAKALTLLLPLAQAGSTEVRRAAEEEGFFFSGLGPAFFGDSDALLLQYLAEDLDLALLQLVDPFAKDLLAYVGAQREAVRRTRQP